MRKVVHLRVYKGKEILKLESGKVKNENQIVSLVYDTFEYENYLKNLKNGGFCKVEVEKFFELKDSKYVSVDIPKSVSKGVEIAFKGDKTKNITPQEQKIADLEAKLEAFINKDKKEDEIDDNDELKDLQSKYEDKFNKKPHHKMGIKKLKEELK